MQRLYKMRQHFSKPKSRNSISEYLLNFALIKPPMESFSKMIEERGWKYRVVPISHLADLEEAILGRLNVGLIDETLYREKLSFLSFAPPADLPNARSIIIVALPTPQMRIFFNWQGVRVPVVLPPTYLSYRPRTRSVQKILSKALKPEGYRVADAKLPLKTLAVRSGLAEYGRNNICYVKGMGSFLQLVGAYSDMPGDVDSWREPVSMARCGSCVACLRHCPTGAIGNDRFLLHADLCLTYHNESARDFPDWISPSYHHCLFGCMRCQAVCPENKSVRDWFEDCTEFSARETELLISSVPFTELPAETAAKVESLEISEGYDQLCRNLGLVISR
jgi:epoxyqueuosine reductase